MIFRLAQVERRIWRYRTLVLSGGCGNWLEAVWRMAAGTGTGTAGECPGAPDGLQAWLQDGNELEATFSHRA
jgi:hypothetical protein